MLYGITRVSQFDAPQREHAFEILTPRRPYVLAASTAEEAASWMAALGNVLKRSYAQVGRGRAACGRRSRAAQREQRAA
jgi:hypothetical protein